MDNVVILVEDDPAGRSPTCSGCTRGTRSPTAAGTTPACCPTGSSIFRNPTCAICDTEDDVVDEVAVTVVHEIAHHFGIDDDRLHELGWG